jgi:hypothetical protein
MGHVLRYICQRIFFSVDQPGFAPPATYGLTAFWFKVKGPVAFH